MYLKEIKANGFKSFADKINISFENEITGIVGPNGSGKSNIVDAVRWVLGEQSVKSLRGNGSMTDVIFSGSKTRNPSSSASITLIFDNSDRYFPVDYAEVSIKRVVYKTGDNEYFINGEKCRLKDITNLVIDTGVGKEAFNIISQGNIQEILSNRPEDRRILFEEAAGVLKYKKRKEEAIRKLDRTNDNINRIDDIINELEIQVEPLKEQSEKATIYLDNKKELEQVEIALMVNDIETINNEYQDTKIKIDSLNDEILSLSKNNTTYQAELEKEKMENVKGNEELYQLQQQLVEASGEVEKLKGQKILITERQKYQTNDVKTHDNVLLLKEQQLKINSDIANTEKDIMSKRSEAEEFNQKIEDFISKIDEARKSRGYVQQQLSDVTRTQIEAKHRINVLEQSIENGNMLPNAVRQVLSNPKLKGVHNIIGKLIVFDDQYLTAIEVALGASANFIVVDNEKVAKESINYLKSNNGGRATFFPLNVIKARHIDLETYENIKQHSAFVDIASNIVSYDDQYKNVVLNQLGNVIVAASLEGANEIGKLIHHRYKIVTLDGELLHIGGSITGGNIKRNIGVMNEKNELAQIKQDLDRMVHQQQKLQSQLSDIELLIDEYDSKNNNLVLEKTKLDNIIDNKDKMIEEYKSKLLEIESEMKSIDNPSGEGLSSEEETILDEYYKANDKKNDLIRTIEQLSKKIGMSKEKITEIESLEKQSNSEFFKKQTLLKELEIKLNRMDVKLDNLLNNLNEEYAMTFDKAKKEYILAMDEKEARKKVNSLKSTIRELGEVNIAAIDEYKRISQRYEFLLNQKNDLFKAENMLLEIIKEMDIIMKGAFKETFDLIQNEFKVVFKKLFGGGSAELKLTDPNNILETGIDIVALPPGKKLQHISLLSGGEKALTAISLLFSVLRVRPVPFCLLDEVEAALDEVNVEGFAKFLLDLKKRTQFIIITHKKKTMEYVDSLYGITMQESGVSKLVSVKLEEIKA